MKQLKRLFVIVMLTLSMVSYADNFEAIQWLSQQQKSNGEFSSDKPLANPFQSTAQAYLVLSGNEQLNQINATQALDFIHQTVINSGYKQY